MGGKLVKELISRMWLLLSMMQEWMLNLNCLKQEMLSFQVNLMDFEISYLRSVWSKLNSGVHSLVNIRFQTCTRQTAVIFYLIL